MIIHSPDEEKNYYKQNIELQANPPSMRVQSSTILSNVIDGVNSVGLVTSTGNTQIVNGVTTVNAIRVFGTYLPGGKYAQAWSLWP